MNDVSPLATTPHPVKLRIEDFVLLDQAGAFSDYAKSELIEATDLVEFGTEWMTARFRDVQR